jgi:hypothetical protein
MGGTRTNLLFTMSTEQAEGRSRPQTFLQANDELFHSTGIGGAGRDRTDDPLLAKQVLSQLSYGP